MKIISAGMHCSGSTWLYNTLRMIFSSQGKSVYGCFFNQYDPDQAAGSDVEIIKLHAFKQIAVDQADLVFMTRRDLHDVAASGIRRGMIQPNALEVLDFLHRGIELEHNPWLKHVNMIVSYENMIKSRPSMVEDIAKVIGVKVKPAQVAQMVNRLKPTAKFNAVTQLHKNHITNGRSGSYKQTLSKPLIAKINKRYGAWLKRYGYKLK